MAVSVVRSTCSRVWTVVLSRPAHRNAVDGPTAAALHGAFLDFESDPEARAAVLYGAPAADGVPTFCAGADLKALAAAAGGDAAGDPRVNPVTPVVCGDRLQGPAPMGPTRMALRKPVVAAVDGACVAGGLELALWCDLRVASPGAYFGVFCRRWGVPLVDGGTLRLPRVVGQGRALDMVLTGRRVEAAEALAMGLVSRLVPPEGSPGGAPGGGCVRAAAEALAHELAAHPQACLRADRAATLAQWGLPEEAALAAEFRGGKPVLGGAVRGAGLFAGGEGRGGRQADSGRQADGGLAPPEN